MDKSIIEEVVNRFKARQFLFNVMHIHELYLVFKPHNTLHIILKMDQGHDMEEQRERLSVFFAATLGWHLDFTFYIMNVDSYGDKNALIKINSDTY